MGTAAVNSGYRRYQLPLLGELPGIVIACNGLFNELCVQSDQYVGG